VHSLSVVALDLLNVAEVFVVGFHDVGYALPLTLHIVIHSHLAPQPCPPVLLRHVQSTATTTRVNESFLKCTP
jgi:hypothetical protein